MLCHHHDGTAEGEDRADASAQGFRTLTDADVVQADQDQASEDDCGEDDVGELHDWIP